jgi:hypothetical protein
MAWVCACAAHITGRPIGPLIQLQVIQRQVIQRQVIQRQAIQPRAG